MNFDNGNVLSLNICHGPKKSKIDILSSAKLSELNEKIENTLSIRRDGQKLIFKGKLLNDPESTLLSLGIKNGDVVMALGKMVRHERDSIHIELDKVGNSLQAAEANVKIIIQDIESLGNDTYQCRSNQQKFKDSMKKLLLANEELMKLLETLDALQIEVSSEEVRSRRKSIVKNIQKLMDQVDKNYSRLEANYAIS